MIRFYSPVFLLQLFCLYLVFSKGHESKWYLIILFFPLIGSLIYLYVHFYNRKNIDNITEEVKTALVSNYKISELEKQLAFSDTVANKMALADEHLAAGNNQQAYDLYQSCQTGIYSDDTALLLKLIKSGFLVEDYETVIRHGIFLEPNKEFSNAIEKTYYAWALHFKGDEAKALEVFTEMDVQFSHYAQRIEFARYLQKTEEKEKAMEKLTELYNEIESMDRHEKRMKKGMQRKVQELYMDYNK